jgi:hypothetical protein
MNHHMIKLKKFKRIKLKLRGRLLLSVQLHDIFSDAIHLNK